MDLTEKTDLLLARIGGGEPHAMGELFELYSDRLLRMISLRLDGRVAKRVSAEDVLQEAYLDISKRIGEYIAARAVPFYVWLRFLAVQRLQMIHRAHLGAGARDVAREANAPAAHGSDFAGADSLAGQLVGKITSPSHAAMRAELQMKLREALEAMDPMDREVLALRHFEELSNNEVAAILEISRDAASKRHIRALKRLKEILSDGEGSLAI